MTRFNSPLKRFRKSTLSVWSFLATLFVFFLLLQIPVLADIYTQIEARVVRLGTGIGSGMARLTQSKKTLTLKFEQCEVDRRNLAAAKNDQLALEHQIHELQALLNYAERTQIEGLTTRIIARAVDGDTARVIIDKGEVDGITNGSAAVIDDGVLYGIVEKTHQTSSVVRLLTSTYSRIPATIFGENRTSGLVEGRNGAVLLMEYIPRDIEINSGNLVITSGLDGLIREGLVIGLVTEVVTIPSAPFKQALIELLYEPREQTMLLILPSPGV